MSIIQEKKHLYGIFKNLRSQKDDLVPEKDKMKKLQAE